MHHIVNIIKNQMWVLRDDTSLRNIVYLHYLLNNKYRKWIDKDGPLI